MVLHRFLGAVAIILCVQMLIGVTQCVHLYLSVVCVCVCVCVCACVRVHACMSVPVCVCWLPCKQRVCGYYMCICTHVDRVNVQVHV